MRRRPRGALLFLLAGVLAVFAAFVAATGGIDTRIAGIAVRSRSWERPATVAFVLALAGLYAVRQTLRSWGPLASRAVVPVLVAWALFAALCFGTYAAGGADSFGYLSQAKLFAQGRLTGTMPRHKGFDWPDVPATLTPLAYTRNAVARRARARLPARPLADDGAADADPRERGVPAGAVVCRVDRLAHGCARAPSCRAGGRGARGAARRREPDVSAAGGTADERRAGRRALALRSRPRTPAVTRCGDSGRRRLVAGHSRAAQPGAAASARRGGVRHAEARAARSAGRRVFRWRTCR